MVVSGKEHNCNVVVRAQAHSVVVKGQAETGGEGQVAECWERANAAGNFSSDAKTVRILCSDKNIYY